MDLGDAYHSGLLRVDEAANDALIGFDYFRTNDNRVNRELRHGCVAALAMAVRKNRQQGYIALIKDDLIEADEADEATPMMD